jgi:plastocyanin
MSGRILSGAALAVAVLAASHASAARADCNTAQSASEQHVGQAAVNVAAGGIVQGNTFSPCNVTIDPGTAVHWTISPSGGHTVDSDGSAPAAFHFTGDGGTFTFTTPGSYFYYCAFHGTPGAPGTGMNGVVYVTGQGAPPPPSFAGVKLVSHTVHVTRTRTAPVRVECPSATAGSCGGKLTLTSGSGAAVRLASRSLSIQPGATGTVKLRLPRATFKKLVRHRRLRLGLALDVHDGNGTPSGQANTTLTLKAPPREG